MSAEPYYPDALIFAGERFHLTPEEWDEYYDLVATCRRLGKTDLGTMYRTTHIFLLSKGYKNEYH